MTPLEKAQYEAITQMAENLHDYNRGVLSMLGQADLAAAHEMPAKMAEILIANRDQLTPEPTTLMDALAELPPEAAEIQERIRETHARSIAAWELIQAIIDDARARLNAADPGGMGQAV